jgi:hypothetical protein
MDGTLTARRQSDILYLSERCTVGILRFFGPEHRLPDVRVWVQPDRTGPVPLVNRG